MDGFDDHSSQQRQQQQRQTPSPPPPLPGAIPLQVSPHHKQQAVHPDGGPSYYASLAPYETFDEEEGGGQEELGVVAGAAGGGVRRGNRRPSEEQVRIDGVRMCDRVRNDPTYTSRESAC